MAEKNNAVCSICGRSYYMCLSCKDKIALSPWKLHTDTSEHYKVYQILHGVTTGVYSHEEAKEKLHMVDLSDLDTFNENIQKRINDILKEEIVVDTVAETSIDEVPKAKQSRKKRYSQKVSGTEE